MLILPSTLRHGISSRSTKLVSITIIMSNRRNEVRLHERLQNVREMENEKPISALNSQFEYNIRRLILLVARHKTIFAGFTSTL